MARFRLLWLEIARDYYQSLPTEMQLQVHVRLAQLLDDPRPSDAGYDEATDQWTTTYGNGAGLILYAVVDERERVIILRLV